MRSTAHGRKAQRQAASWSPGTRRPKHERRSRRPSPRRHPQGDTKINVSSEKGTRNLGACGSQMVLRYSRDPCVSHAVDKLPQMVFGSGAKLPCEPAPLILLLVLVAES